MPRLRASRLTAIASGARGFIMSVFADTDAAYSLRIPACSTYDGPLLSGRRSTDGAQTDIYAYPRGYLVFDRWLDEQALLAFAGSASVFVTTWYDQSGNGRHETQAIADLQPRVVNAGVVDKLGGRPAVYFNGSTYLDAAFSSAVGGKDLLVTHTARLDSFSGVSAFARVTSASPVNSQSWAWSGGFTTTLNSGGPGFGTEDTDAGYTLAVSGQSQIAVGTAFVYSFEASNTAHRGSLNGTITANFLPLTAPDTWTFPTLRLGRDTLAGATNTFLTGAIAEVVVSKKSFTSARQTLERSQGAAFGITVA